MNWKKLFLAFLFIELVQLTVVLKHDIYQVFIAFVALMFAYYLSSFITDRRFWRLILFVFIALVVCQISVTAKKAQIDQDFNQRIKINPTGVIVGDIVHASKRIAGLFRSDIKDSIIGAKNSDEYLEIERMNYRYLSLAICGLPMCSVILLKRTKRS